MRTIEFYIEVDQLQDYLQSDAADSEYAYTLYCEATLEVGVDGSPKVREVEIRDPYTGRTTAGTDLSTPDEEILKLRALQEYWTQLQSGTFDGSENEMFDD